MAAIKTIPFQGGCNTSIEPVLLKPGEYSLIRNMRGQHPGMETRYGQLALHTSADGTNQVMSLYPFSKGRRTEEHLFAQMGDGDVLEATALPPGITTGAFGPEVFDGTASPLPASWSNLLDNLLFSNGVDQHQIWSGSLAYVRKFVLYRNANPWNPIPTIGQDYTDKVTDGVSTTSAPMNGLGTLAADALLICIPTIPSGLKFTVGVANTTTATMTINYWNGTVQTLSVTDNTAAAGKTLAQTGTVTWTPVTDAKTYSVYGVCGYWLAISFSAALSATTAITTSEYLSSWQPIANVWDGVLMDAIEALTYTAGTTIYKTYGGAAINVGALGASDVIYFGTTDPIFGIFIDVGQTPNATAGTTISSFKFWNGTAWTTVGTLQDGTNGLKNSGWIIWPTLTADPQPLNLLNSSVYMYWWQMQVSNTLSANMTIWVQYQPMYDINELGKGVTNCAWKGRAVYSFDRWPDYLYISKQGDPQALNGNDYGIIQVGDGRSHRVTAMRKFHNELLVWQEEKGEIGGCLTLIEGYSPQTYGKLILSSRLGAMNAKCVAVVDGVLTSTVTDETIKTLAFALSRYGVYATDGRTCSMVDDDIHNYFDPTKAECIRKGYENQMWLAYDSGQNNPVLRLGLVSGASATVPNVFPVFDLIDKSWTFDTLGQALSCQIDIGAGSGNVAVLQIAGGTADGTVYQINTGVNDVSTPISALVRMEIDGEGIVIDLREMILRIKARTAGSFTLTPYINSIAQTAKTLLMTPEIANQTIRRHRFNLNIKGHHISLEFSLNVADQRLFLEDFWPLLVPYREQ